MRWSRKRGEPEPAGSGPHDGRAREQPGGQQGDPAAAARSARNRLIDAALDTAIDDARVSADGFTPFALIDSIDERRPLEARRQLLRFALGGDASLTDCQAAGREALRTVDADVTCVALAWDGYLTIDGERSEAVYVEACEVGQDNGVRVAQRYVRSGGTLTVQGSPVVTRQTEPLVQFRLPPGPAAAPPADGRS